MKRITRNNRAIVKTLFAQLFAISCAAIFVSLNGCGGGGGLSGDNQSADPGTVEYPIAYVQRPAPAVPAPANAKINDLQDPFAFNPGAKLLVRSRADSSAQEINVTDALFPGQENLYDVKDLAVSPDGKNLVFALHKPMLKNAQPIDQPSWDIWIYNFATKEIRAVIASKNKSEGSDVAPQFLADGRIVFVSDRQTRIRQQLTDSGSPAYSGLTEKQNIKAGVLHIMNADGSGIDQISYNQSHDLSPSQLRNGKLVFTRWDNMNGSDRMDLYTLNPSGMNLSFLYGYNSHGTDPNPDNHEQFSQPREMEDGRLVTILRPYKSKSMGGDLVAIDVAHFSDNMQPTWENPTATGPAQHSLAVNPVKIDPNGKLLSPGGEFGAVWPLFDGTGRMLISWSQCRYLDTNNVIRPCTSSTSATATPAPLLYGVWIFDPKAQTQKPVVPPIEGVIYTDIVAASPAKNIAAPVDNSVGHSTSDLQDYGNNILNVLSTNNTAVLDIRSVYNLDGGIGNFGMPAPANMIANQVIPSAAPNSPYQTRRARFLQIVEGVPLPDPNDKIPTANNQILRVPGFAFGAGNYLRHIVGYAPIEADGSVVVQVPADVPITFNILDANAQRLNSSADHNVWLHFRAGEVVRCTGCHDSVTASSTTLTHGRSDSNAPDANPGTTSSGYFAGVSDVTVNNYLQSTRVGQTMAEAYAGAAANQSPPLQGVRLPSLNLYFEDEWAVDSTQANPTLDYRYKTAAAPQVPAIPVGSDSCLGTLNNPLLPLLHWDISCRIVINYLDHIQPIWEKPRTVGTDGSVLPSNMQCISCHAPTNAMGVAQIPASQLDLSHAASNRDDKRVMSYSELFPPADMVRDITGAPLQQITNGTPVVDGEGNPVFTPVLPSMIQGNAQSSYFFTCFTGNTCREQKDVNTAAATYVDHTKLLTKGELRLISEWLDNGGQYYNDVLKAAAAQ